MSTRTISLIRDGFPDREGLDIAISRALLVEASSVEAGETFRLHTPGRVVAFGKHDTLTAGYAAAIAAATSAGFSPEKRIAGGRAAVFHEGTLAFSWTIPDPDPVAGVQARFDVISRLMVRAFARLGVDSAVGEIEGEYCPGRYSVHHRGRIKLMGVGQRLSRDAAHVGGVVVVRDSALVNQALAPVYGALRLPFDPGATGALDSVDETITPDDATAAIIAELSRVADIEVGVLSNSTLGRAEALVPDHLPGG